MSAAAAQPHHLETVHAALRLTDLCKPACIPTRLGVSSLYAGATRYDMIDWLIDWLVMSGRVRGKSSLSLQDAAV